MSEAALQKLREKIDNYIETVFTIIAFMNLYLFDKTTGKNRQQVRVFQGRRMSKRKNDANVTPDILIQIRDEYGIVGEVKISFPRNQELWLDDFQQIMAYDDDLKNWCTPDEDISAHEVALLVHRNRAVQVAEYLEEKMGSGIVHFNRNFYVVEFNREDRARTFIYMRSIIGHPGDFYGIRNQLKYGVEIPLIKLVERYEKTMLYDSKPPIAYLLFIIHQFFLSNKAASHPEFAGVRRNKTLKIKTSISEISEYLNENYSFKKTNSDSTAHQPYIPPQAWIIDAVDAFAAIKLANWTDKSAGECELFYRRGLKKSTFEELCIKHNIEVVDEESQTKFDLSG